MVSTEVCFSFWLSCTMRGGSNSLGHLYKDTLILFSILLNVESMSPKKTPLTATMWSVQETPQSLLRASVLSLTDRVTHSHVLFITVLIFSFVDRSSSHHLFTPPLTNSIHSLTASLTSSLIHELTPSFPQFTFTDGLQCCTHGNGL